MLSSSASGSSTSVVRCTVARATFDQLRSLLQQMGESLGEQNAVVVTDSSLLGLSDRWNAQIYPFTLLLSPSFNALVQGVALEDTATWQENWQIQIAFDSETIAATLTHLKSLTQSIPLLERAYPPSRLNDPVLQGEFTLRLVELLNVPQPSDPAEISFPFVSVCQPVEDALRQQVEQERLLNQVAAQIRQSLELPIILETAVQQVRHFLQVDRLVLFQFSLNSPSPYPKGTGRITYESILNDTIPSVLQWEEGDQCFVEVPTYYEKYRRGLTLVVKDVAVTYQHSPCLLDLMQRAGVRAKLVVPIVVQQDLWGLLIAHQCQEPRQWLDSEVTFLKHIAEHLEIAIYQAQLFAEVQQQKAKLEERVIARTQELHDALMAAESGSRAKSEFLAAMSHELRTPLTSVIGMSSTLLRWSFGELNDRQRHYLQIIHDSGEHLMALINDILDLCQVEAGKTVLKITEFSLFRLARQTLHSLQEKADTGNVKLEEDLQISQAQDAFTGDRRRIKQILLNLLSNAIKFTPEGGKVILRAWLEGNVAVLQVEDTGIGISQQQRSQLFQKFQQLDSSYDRRYEGTGLGLALTKQLVELHGGCIEVESTVGVGSIFTVKVPPKPLAEPQELSPSVGNGEPPAGSILLIEGHEDNATLICELLTTANYQVVWLMDGSTALRQVAILQPLIVITAVTLPDMSGYEVIQTLRSTPMTRGVKIIALTDERDSVNHVLPHPEEADVWLSKPIHPEDLLNRVIALLHGQASLVTSQSEGKRK
ncbi:MAG: ATP-binding protein [Leptolyngbyaceae cyanobacterium bins.59]|nr:ATP-binding protein [Leptolyngbyaceae cyanobacterium bins.59]